MELESDCGGVYRGSVRFVCYLCCLSQLAELVFDVAIGFDRGTVVPVCWRGIQSGERGEKDKRAHKHVDPYF